MRGSGSEHWRLGPSLKYVPWQVLRKLLKFDPVNELVIHVAMDNTLILSEVKEACLRNKQGTFAE